MKKFLLILALIFCAAKGENVKEIYLAGGCFWGVEGYFERVSGVKSTRVGYANGGSENASYHSLKSSGHAETVLVKFDEDIVGLPEILERYFSVIDPFSVNKQGNDRGEQYRTGIFWKDEALGERVKAFVAMKQKSYDRPFAVLVEPLRNFVEAEEYHQKYLDKNPGGYCHIDLSAAKKSVYNDSKFKTPSKSELKSNLNALQYEVTQEKGTERPFSSEYNHEKRKGIFIDVTTKKPLFASTDKFDSGTGWPSFTKPITTDALKYNSDTSHGMFRTEVTSSLGGAHLGHVFNDGPKDRGGLRYCINGASLEFIPLEEMDERGYGEYKIYVK